ncbi:MAG: chemotaxis protein CheD [Dethiobacteraceae bacterium]|jgi:chemotaxis protein CheD
MRKLELVVGIGEYRVSRQKNAVLKTYALSSCVAVTAYSPAQQAAGMIHIALPAPFTGAQGQLRPAYYAVTGVPLLIREMCAGFGCSRQELIINLYGGAESIRPHDIFNIGRKNLQAVRQALAQLNLTVKEADVGGRVSRTLSMDVATGLIKTVTQPLTI